MMKRLSALGLAIVLAACTQDPFTREDKVSNAAIGGAAGAAAGGLAGAIVDADSSADRRRNILIGAGLGLVGGLAVGVYMDRQEEELRKSLEATGVSVTRRDDNLVLNLPSNLSFGPGSALVSPSAHSVLASVAVVLKEFDRTLVDVLGHSDDVGPAEGNMALSKKRAVNVAQVLLSEGILPDRILVRGYGETQPLAPNDTPEGRALNRRVEIHIAPLG